MEIGLLLPCTGGYPYLYRRCGTRTRASTVDGGIRASTVYGGTLPLPCMGLYVPQTRTPVLVEFILA